MARRRDSLLQFDLVPEDHDDAPHPPAEPHPELEPRAVPEPSRLSLLLAHWRRRWAAVPRRRRVLVTGVAAATVVVVVAAGVAVDAERDRRHAATMRTLPGGIADVSVPADVAWELDSDTGVIAVLPGGVVVTREIADLLGVDVTTGEVLWRHTLGTAPDCGPTSTNVAEMLREVEQVVCISGEPEERTVVVIDGAGDVVGERGLGEANSYAAGEWVEGAPQALPAADGAVAVLEGADMTTTLPAEGDVLARLDALRESGRWTDPVLRLEDALTGEVRGEATVHIRDVEQVEGCVQDLNEENSGGDAEKEELGLWLSTSVGSSPTAAWAMVCNAGVAMLADGTVVDDDADGYAWPSGSADGGLLLNVGDQTRVIDAQGRETGTFPGYVLDPTATDGLAGPVLSVDEELRVGAYDADGEPRWTSEVQSFRFLARTAGTAVVVSAEEDVVVGLDLDTGDVLWTRDDLGSGRDGGYGAGTMATTVVTDGSRVLLGRWFDGGYHLLALDARSGRTVWDTEHEDALGSLLAVDGHLLAFHEGTDIGQEEVDGVLVETQDATLRGLATG